MWLNDSLCILYSGRVWRGESLANLANRRWFAKLKPSKWVVTIDNLLAELFIRQTFFRQMLRKGEFAKVSPCQTFPLHGNSFIFIVVYCWPHYCDCLVYTSIWWGLLSRRKFFTNWPVWLGLWKSTMWAQKLTNFFVCFIITYKLCTCTYTNKILKSLPPLQNLMGFLLKFTEMGYLIQRSRY